MKHELRKYMDKVPAAFTLTALLIIAMIGMPITLAYFSDYASADGSKDVHLEWQTKLNENVKDNNKHITIDNIGETPVIVRVQMFATDELSSVRGDSWIKGNDGWWYYKSILGAGETMATEDELYAEVKGSDKLPEEAFNIIVVHESQRVVYEDNDTLAVPDGWDADAVAAISVK